jgi:hypothetical protein
MNAIKYLMKYLPILSLCLATAAAGLQAQEPFRLESASNRMQAGDRIHRQEIPYTEPGTGGDNRLWDLRGVKPVEHTVFRLTVPAENIDPNSELTPFVREEKETTFETAFWKMEDGTVLESSPGGLQYYNPSGDSLLVWGFETPSLRIRYTRPEVALCYPFAFGDRISSPFHGTGTWCDVTRVNLEGTLTVEADARGTLILPGGDTLRGVLRIKSVRTAVESRSPLSQAAETAFQEPLLRSASEGKPQIITETYSWYAPGYRYPVWETTRTLVRTPGKEKDTVPNEPGSFLYAPEDQAADNPATEKPISNAPAGNETLASASLKVYPNPATDRVEVELSPAKEEDIEISLFSLQGQILYRKNAGKQSGTVHHTVPVENLPAGSYLLRITCGKSVTNKKIIKQ